MKGTPILLAFFVLFAGVSLLIPIPLFPGNLLTGFAESWTSEYSTFLGALLNGVFYAAILWLVFLGISRKLAEEG